MSQATYSVGLLDADGTPVYRGTLQVQLTSNGIGGQNATAGLLSLNGFTPLLLSAPGGSSGNSWNLSGSNDSLSVPVSSITPTVQPQGAAPTWLADSITVQPAGQAEQNLLFMGFQPGAPAAVPGAHAQAEAAAENGALEAAAADDGSLNFTLALVNESFAPAGTAAFTGQGTWISVSPVSKYWRVTGTLTGDGLPAGGLSMQGGGRPFGWTVRSQSSDPQVTLQVIGSTFIQNISDGTLTVGAATSYFVGTPVAASTLPVPHLAQPAAEPA